MGPMVKLLGLHHPVRVVEDLCVIDNLTNGRAEFGVGRGVAPIEFAWFGSDWPSRADRFEDALRIVRRALRTGEITAEGSAHYRFHPMTLSTRPVQETIPFWYPGSPETAGRLGCNLMVIGPVSQEDHDRYLEAWYGHQHDEHRYDGPGAAPRIGCTISLAMAADEATALEVSARAMDGLMRRIMAVHAFDAQVVTSEEADAALAPLRRARAHREVAIRAGAGTPSQVRDRFGEILAAGRTDHLVLQLPTGDMTMDEAKLTMELFCREVQPALVGA